MAESRTEKTIHERGSLNSLRDWCIPRGIIDSKEASLRGLGQLVRGPKTQVVGKIAGLFSDRREISTDLMSSMRRVEPNFLGGFDHLGSETARLLGLGLDESQAKSG